MIAQFERSFARDLKKVRDRDVLSRIERAITDVKAAQRLAEVRGVESIRGDSTAYRIRMGDYRIGIRLSGETITFVRCLHRREIYRYFP